jgi:hypothetical protein
MRFDLPPSVVDRLRARRAASPLVDATEREHDAFLVLLGTGASLYVTADGRILVDCSGWDSTPIREATDEEAFATLVVAADRTGIRELVELLPHRPENGVTCTRCGGTRHEPSAGVCLACSGLGWLVPIDPALRKLHEQVKAFIGGLGLDVEQKGSDRRIFFSHQGGLFAAAHLHPYPARVVAFATVDPATVRLEAGFTRAAARSEWVFVRFDDLRQDVEVTIRSMDDLDRAKPLFRAGYSAERGDR